MTLPEFDARHVPSLRAVEDQHFWFRSRNRVIGAVVEQLEPRFDAGYRVLEVGCGTGNTLQVLDATCTRGVVVGMDRQYEGLVHARARVTRPLVQGDVSHLPFAPGAQFDLIGLFDVLEHLDDDQGVLRILQGRLTPGGRLLVTVPASPRLWSAFDVAVHHRRRYTATDLGDRLRAANLSIEFLSPFMMGLYPLTWLRRRVVRAVVPDSDAVASDLTVVPGLNVVLGWLLAGEPRRMSARRRLPFGTSLIAVASKH
jgi:SAM-dependent methyltransferase